MAILRRNDRYHPGYAYHFVVLCLAPEAGQLNNQSVPVTLVFYPPVVHRVDMNIPILSLSDLLNYSVTPFIA